MITGRKPIAVRGTSSSGACSELDAVVESEGIFGKLARRNGKVAAQWWVDRVPISGSASLRLRRDRELGHDAWFKRCVRLLVP